MPKFDIAVTWSVYGVYKKVEAATLEEAIRKVEEAEEECSEFPKNAEYIDDSMVVNMDVTRELNPKDYEG